MKTLDGRRTVGGPFSKCSNCVSTSDQLDLQLLHGAQAFLRCLQQNSTPASKSKEDWERFYSVCDCLLRRYAISCHVRPDDLDDCLQSVWREITVALPKFQDHGQIGRFYAWLHLVVRCKAADLCRYRVRHPARVLTPKKEARLRTRELDPASACEQCDLVERTKQVLAELRQHVSSTNYRAFHLRYIEERPAIDVAAQLNLSVKQVRYRCYRVKKKFRRLYETKASHD